MRKPARRHDTIQIFHFLMPIVSGLMMLALFCAKAVTDRLKTTARQLRYRICRLIFNSIMPIFITFWFLKDRIIITNSGSTWPCGSGPFPSVSLCLQTDLTNWLVLQLRTQRSGKCVEQFVAPAPVFPLGQRHAARQAYVGIESHALRLGK